MNTGSGESPCSDGRRLSGAVLPLAAKRFHLQANMCLRQVTATRIVVGPGKASPALTWRPLGTHQTPIYQAFPSPVRRWRRLHLTKTAGEQHSDKQPFHHPSCKNNEPLHEKGVRLHSLKR